MRGIVALLGLLAAGCAGGPLQERPVLQPPPAPEAATAPAELAGAWRSVAASGPGSASAGRIVMVFERNGGICGASFGPGGARAFAGTWTEMDGAVQVDLGAGDVRVWLVELEPGSLLLRDDEKVLRLEPFR